ncbi:MAG: DUF3422 domain-containing protein [Burkholderiales bacterium]|nr:DUF3422 domain-containing protein [Burkholderiales bacterium]
MATPLPPDDPLRASLHDEVHARPSARIRLPALVVQVAVLHEGVDRAAELAQLQRLPGHEGLDIADLRDNFLRLRVGDHTLRWERHTEFTRYTLMQVLPEGVAPPASDPELLSSLGLPPLWLAQIPGRTLAAIKLVMLTADIADPQAALDAARHWFGDRPVASSLMGRGHSIAATDFKLRPTGFERILVFAPRETTPTRAGRIAQRLLELETYRMMALRGLPVAKALAPMLGEAERALADITARLEAKRDDDEALLDTLVALAARIERANAEHLYRFDASAAYAAIVAQRLAELRELPIPGTQTIGEFMQRRLSPAIATVASTAQRLASLSQRIERAGALLRTRVDIATEARSRQLLEKLTRGQAMQLRLQATVEGLSIAAISYYVVSLVLYAAKAAKAAGLRLHPELSAGLSIPFVLWGVAWLTRRIHRRLRG